MESIKPSFLHLRSALGKIAGVFTCEEAAIAYSSYSGVGIIPSSSAAERIRRTAIFQPSEPKEVARFRHQLEAVDYLAVQAIQPKKL